jgi:hypothetical protein
MNNKPVFRNPDKYQVLEWREWMRDNLPNGKSGMVVEDLDLVPLLFGPLVNRQRDEDGKFMLIEIKTAFGQMGYAQRRLFSMMHKLLRKADPDRKYYIGFYLVRWNNGKPESVNNARVTEQKFIEFMTGKATLESMFDA